VKRRRGAANSKLVLLYFLLFILTFSRKQNRSQTLLRTYKFHWRLSVGSRFRAGSSRD